MAEYLKDYSGLAAAGSAFEGFASAFEKAQDAKYKRLASEAEKEALKTRMQREADELELNTYKAGLKKSAAGGYEPRELSVMERVKEEADSTGKGVRFKYDEQKQPIPGTSYYDPQYLDARLKEREALANYDPFGVKRTNAENAAKPRVDEFVAAGYARRMDGAEGKLQALLEGKGGGEKFDPTSIGVQAQQAFLKGPLESKKSGPVKQYVQLVKDFASAVLRKESGAAISPQEYKDVDYTYFPQPGDTPEVLAAKKATRDQARANFVAQAGKAYNLIPQVPVVPVGPDAGTGGLVKKQGLVGDKGLIGGAPQDNGLAAKLKRIQELEAKAAKAAGE